MDIKTLAVILSAMTPTPETCFAAYDLAVDIDPNNFEKLLSSRLVAEAPRIKVDATKTYMVNNWTDEDLENYLVICDQTFGGS